MVAKTHTDDPFWKFRDQPQEKVAISACCWPRNPSDIAERLYRRRRTATLLFILLILKKGNILIKKKEKKHFMVINNNWKKERDYSIDFDGYSSDLVHEGFGTFVVVRDKAWF